MAGKSGRTKNKKQIMKRTERKTMTQDFNMEEI